MRSPKLIISMFLAIALPRMVPGQSSSLQSLVVELSGGTFAGWTGVQPGKQGVADWNLEGSAVFKYPQGQKGWYRHGFRDLNDSSADWRNFYGVELDVLVPQGRALELQAAIAIPRMFSRQEFVPESHAALTVSGEG